MVNVLIKYYAVNLEQATKAQKGRKGTLSLTLALDGGEWSSQPSHFSPMERDRLGWTHAQNLAPTTI
jgi:hypothetical protein